MTILEIEDDVAIFTTQTSNHEHDLKAHVEMVARESELVERSSKIRLVYVRGRFPLGKFLEGTEHLLGYLDVGGTGEASLQFLKPFLVYESF